MPRIRTVKPEFWSDEKLSTIPRDARLLLIGLLNFADDSGRMRGSPLLIRAQVFPYDTDIDSESLLRILAERSLIVRYEVEGESYIWIRNFTKHQKIDHPSESVLPGPPTGKSQRHSAKPPRTLAEPSLLERKGKEQGTGKGKEEEAQGSAPQTPSAVVWDSYAKAYQVRYGTEPVRNGKVNGQLAQLVKRLPVAEAPDVAAYYLGHNASKYVGAGHSVGLLLIDCEKLRTEWATGRQVTHTAARHQDQTQENLDGWERAGEEMKRGLVRS